MYSKKSMNHDLRFDFFLTSDLVVEKCFDRKNKYKVIFLESGVLEYLPNILLFVCVILVSKFVNCMFRPSNLFGYFTIVPTFANCSFMPSLSRPSSYAVAVDATWDAWRYAHESTMRIKVRLWHIWGATSSYLLRSPWPEASLRALAWSSQWPSGAHMVAWTQRDHAQPVAHGSPTKASINSHMSACHISIQLWIWTYLDRQWHLHVY